MLPCAIESARASKNINEQLLLACVLGHGWLQKHAFYSISVSARRIAARFDRYVHGYVHFEIDAWSRKFAPWVRKHAICMVFAPSDGDLFECGRAESKFYCYLHGFSIIFATPEAPENPPRHPRNCPRDPWGFPKGPTPPRAPQGPPKGPRGDPQRTPKVRWCCYLHGVGTIVKYLASSPQLRAVISELARWRGWPAGQLDI